MSDELVTLGARLLGDALVDALRRPDVVAAIRSAMAPTTESIPADRLLSKKEVALVLGVSASTVDRLTREGLPVAAHVGDARRYDFEACKAWLARRGKRPTRAPRSEVEICVDDIAAAAGLVRR